MPRMTATRWIAILLSTCLAAPMTPAADSLRDTRYVESVRDFETHWFLSEEGLIRLEVATLISPDGVESIAAAVYRSLRPDSEASDPVSPSASNVAGRIASIGRVPLIDPPPLELDQWFKELEWSVTFDDSSAISAYRVGPDRISIRFPREPAAPEAAPVVVEINGSVARVDADVLSNALDKTAPRFRVRAEETPAPLHDPDGFTASWLRFRKAMEIAHGKRWERAGDPAKTQCTGKCLGCFAGLIGTFGSSLAIVGTCGGALVTGGTTAFACLIAFIAHEGAMVSTAAACGSCSACISTGRRGSRDRRDETCCPCLGEPSCNCPTSCDGSGNP